MLKSVLLLPLCSLPGTLHRPSGRPEGDERQRGRLQVHYSCFRGGLHHCGIMGEGHGVPQLRYEHCASGWGGLCWREGKDGPSAWPRPLATLVDVASCHFQSLVLCWRFSSSLGPARAGGQRSEAPGLAPGPTCPPPECDPYLLVGFGASLLREAPV